MTVKLLEASNEEIPALRRLMQLYLYDIAALDDWDIGGDGLYGNPERIESFWNREIYDPFLIHVDGVIAGFVLTSRRSGEGGERIQVISEFFVLRRYRREGVGRTAATILFGGAEGIWELCVMASNAPAQEFWAVVIGDFTGKKRDEFLLCQSEEDGSLYRFRTAGNEV